MEAERLETILKTCIPNLKAFAIIFFDSDNYCCIEANNLTSDICFMSKNLNIFCDYLLTNRSKEARTMWVPRLDNNHEN